MCMIRRLLTFSLLLNAVAPFVLFTHSVMYDAQDFVDNRNIKLPSFCSSSGCHVYVAPVPATAEFAANLKIVTKTIVMENNDLRSMSSRYQPNGAKAPGILNPLAAGEDYFIENSNDPITYQSTLMTVYVVSRAAPNIDSSVVFDSEKDIPNPLPARIVMLMDNQLSTLEISSSSTANSVVMRTTGFDNADGKADNCNYVLDTKSTGLKAFPGVQQQLINTQNITMLFDNVNNVVIKRGSLITWNYYLDSDPFTGFLTSAGHIGCKKALNNDELYSIEALRSGNFYPDTFYYLISHEYIMNVHFDWDLNTPPDQPVVVTSNGEDSRFFGTYHGTSSSYTNDTQNVKIMWERLNTGTFMARFTTEPLGKVTDGYHEGTTSEGESASNIGVVFLSKLFTFRSHCTALPAQFSSQRCFKTLFIS